MPAKTKQGGGVHQYNPKKKHINGVLKTYWELVNGALSTIFSSIVARMTTVEIL